MRKPASFTRFLTVACYGVGLVQIAMLVLIAFYVFGVMFLGDRSLNDVPSWIPPLDAALSALMVGIAWVQYRRGELDEVEIRRSRR